MNGTHIMLLIGLAAVATLVWVRRRYVAIRVVGNSMSPTYTSGEVVLIRRTRRVRVGDVVVVEPPYVEEHGPPPAGRRRFIKRVAAVGGDACPEVLTGYGITVPTGTIVILGDSPVRGYDSRSIGFLPIKRVIGVAVRPRPQAAPDRLASGQPAETAAVAADGPSTSLSTSHERGPR